MEHHVQRVYPPIQCFASFTRGFNAHIGILFSMGLSANAMFQLHDQTVIEHYTLGFHCADAHKSTAVDHQVMH